MFYIYKITNNINGMMYIGAHATDNIDDGYLGSGVHIKRAIKKYGKSNFSKEILSVHSSMEEMYLAEKLIVTEELVDSPMYYNLKVGGKGGSRLTKELTEKRNAKIRDTIKKQFDAGREPNRYYPTDEERLARSTARKGKYTGANNHMFGKTVADFMTPEADAQRRKNISNGNKGKTRTDEHKVNYSAYASTRFWIVNKEGKLFHATDINDNRIISGECQIGRKWKSQ